MAEWLSSLLAKQEGPGFDSRPRHMNFQRFVISCFQVEIRLKDRSIDVNPQTTNQPTKNKEEYNVKTSENDVRYNSFNREEMEKSRELYSKDGDIFSWFEGKIVAWEHTLDIHDH